MNLAKSEPALRLDHLSIEFGGLKAVSDLNLVIEEGVIFGLIGPNGAGKTTIFNMITGVYHPTSGTIQAFSKHVARLKPYAITRSGVARTFQNIRLFKDLTVLDNLKIAMDHNPVLAQPNFLSSIFQGKNFMKGERKKEKLCFDLLEIFNLSSRANEFARSLPYGDQRRLEIARAMATNARLLLLDEPAAGLNMQESRDLMTTIRMIRERFHMTILLIEHDMKVVMGICDRIAVVEYGIKIAEGNSTEIQSHPKVIEAYLGRRATQHG